MKGRPPLKPFLQVKVENIKDPFVTEITLEIEALMRNIREQLERIISYGKLLSPDLMFILESVDDPGRLADLVASNLDLTLKRLKRSLRFLTLCNGLKP